MAYPLHWLLSFGGKFNGTGLAPEVWNCNVRGLPDAGSDKDINGEHDTLENIAPLLSQWFNAGSSNMRFDATLEWVKLNQIGPDGKYVKPVTFVHDYAPVVTGGSASPTMPPILTLAFSWTTARSRGPGSHGRIFPPYFLPTDATDVVATATRDAAMASANKLLCAIAATPNTHPGTNFRGMNPMVISKTGVAETITGIRVGSVIDVQRRRKNQIIEQYSSMAMDSSVSFP